MAKTFFTNTLETKTRERNRNTLQVYILIGLGIIFLLGALLLHPDPFAVPAGLFLFGLGLLLSALFNPARLTIAGVLFTLIGAVIFIAYKPIIAFLPYDGGLAVIAIGLALLVIAFLARRGYIGAGAISPGMLVLLVGLILYPPTGRAATKFLAPFILSLWFPGIMLLVIGLVYWFISSRNAKTM